MDTLIWIIAGTFFVSLLGFTGIFSLSLRESHLKKAIFILTSFSIGGLLGGAFFHLLPEAVEELPVDSAMLGALAGFIVFLLIETYFHWHHCSECEIHPYSYLMLIGDGIHNLIDGLVISGSFLVSVPFGIVTTVVIFGHEFPQQLGLFGVLIHGGMEKKKAILYSYVSQSTVILGGVAGYFLAASVESLSSLLLPFAAGGFLYIAASDLVPEMHKEEGAKRMLGLGMVFAGLLLMWALKTFGPHV
ncbi:ZIP family metal transporter [Candidatus Micrarchaeota archaeon]|nr:ZIP family metal transporter [Candidatus Micrarchaeota archaeon]